MIILLIQLMLKNLFKNNLTVKSVYFKVEHHNTKSKLELTSISGKHITSELMRPLAEVVWDTRGHITFVVWMSMCPDASLTTSKDHLVPHLSRFMVSIKLVLISCLATLLMHVMGWFFFFFWMCICFTCWSYEVLTWILFLTNLKVFYITS